MSFDIESYVETRLRRGKHSGGRSGHEMTAECPACDKWGKFYVNSESGSYVCFSCGFRGRSAVGLIAHVEGMTTSEARAYIFKNSVEIRRRDSRAILKDRIAALRIHAISDDGSDSEGPQDFPLPKSFRPVWKGGKWDYPIWLKGRGVKSATARAWGMGYCRVGKWAGRMVIPIECPNGRSFTARDMTGEQEPKYMNPFGADHRKLLIGWNLVPTTSELVLCEGPMDAVKLWQHNIPAVALGGKELHDEQLDLLSTFPESRPIVIMLDPEELEAPIKAAMKLSSVFDNVFIAKLPDGVDPGDSTSEQAHAAVDRATRWSGGRDLMLSAKIKKAGEAIDSRH